MKKQRVLGFHCLTCRHEQKDYTPKCPECSGVISAKYHETQPMDPLEVFARARQRGKNAQAFEPIVYHVMKNGHVSTPAHPNAPVRPGYERREATTLREISRLEKRVNRQELDKAEAHQHREEMRIAMVREEMRPGFLRDVRRMSATGQRIARQAMEMNDARRPQLMDPGVHYEVMHFDRSNRDAHQDSSTGWSARRR